MVGASSPQELRITPVKAYIWTLQWWINEEWHTAARCLILIIYLGGWQVAETFLVDFVSPEIFFLGFLQEFRGCIFILALQWIERFLRGCPQLFNDADFRKVHQRRPAHGECRWGGASRLHP